MTPQEARERGAVAHAARKARGPFAGATGRAGLTARDTVRARTADGVEVKRVLGPDRFGRYDITVLTLSLTDWAGHAAASWTAP